MEHNLENIESKSSTRHHERSSSTYFHEDVKREVQELRCCFRPAQGCSLYGL